MVTVGTRTRMSDINPEGRQNPVLLFYICPIVRSNWSQENHINPSVAGPPSDLSTSHITILGTMFSIREPLRRIPLGKRLCPNQSTNVTKNLGLGNSGLWGHRQTAVFPDMSSWLLQGGEGGLKNYVSIHSSLGSYRWEKEIWIQASARCGCCKL